MNIHKQFFGATQSGTPVDLYTLTNDHGVEIKITNYGGIIASLRTPDRNGKFDDIVLGFDTLEEYLGPHPFFGVLVGALCQPHAHGKFTLKGKEYTLAKNDGENHLHGGVKGFDKVVWRPQAPASTTRSACASPT